MPMAKKNIIEVEYDFDFVLWGIVTTMRDYQICWELNKSLKINLKRQPDVEFSHPQRGRHMLFSLFRYYDEMDKCLYHLMSNKYYKEFLLPEVKEADYLLRFTGEMPYNYAEGILYSLKNVPKIMAVIPLEVSGLKSKHNLIIE
jgi:hypothetical protein